MRTEFVLSPPWQHQNLVPIRVLGWEGEGKNKARRADQRAEWKRAGDPVLLSCRICPSPQMTLLATLPHRRQQQLSEPSGYIFFFRLLISFCCVACLLPHFLFLNGHKGMLSPPFIARCETYTILWASIRHMHHTFHFSCGCITVLFISLFSFLKSHIPISPFKPRVPTITDNALQALYKRAMHWISRSRQVDVAEVGAETISKVAVST